MIFKYSYKVICKTVVVVTVNYNNAFAADWHPVFHSKIEGNSHPLLQGVYENQQQTEDTHNQRQTYISHRDIWLPNECV